MNDTLQTMNNHRSIRKYDDKPIPEEMLNGILKAIHQLPTSINGQQVSVIVVKDEEKRKAISVIAGNQPWIAEAPVFLLFVADYYKTNIGAQLSGKTQVIQESVEGSLVATLDAGIAMGGAIVAAESLGLGIVPIGGIRKSPEEMIRLLELPEYTYPLAGLVLGYPLDLSDKKPRLPIDTFVHDEVYHVENIQKDIEAYDSEMTAYYKDRGDDKQTNWSKQVSDVYQYVYFPKVYPTMKSQGFSNNK